LKQIDVDVGVRCIGCRCNSYRQ